MTEPALQPIVPTSMSWRWLGLLVAIAGCGGAEPGPRPAERAPVPPQGWCSAVDAVLASPATRGLACLSVPNFLVAGFFGPKANPERSDFVNACFAGDGDAATRLRMNVRPVGDLRFRHSSRQRLARGGSLDLGFLGPWAPSVRVLADDERELEIDVSLEDAEMRVLSSVAEILGQELGATPEGSSTRQSLEACVSQICDSREPLVYTAKVLAAVPVITLSAKTSSGRELAVREAGAGFQVDQKKSSRWTITLRAKEKLNVAAQLESAAPALAAAGTCGRVRAARARRSVLAGLREIGLRTLSGRALGDVPNLAAPLRAASASTDGAFGDNEKSTLAQSIEVIEGAARQLALPKPNNSLCANRSLAGTVLGSSEADNSLRSVLVDVLTPIHERLTELANDHALPCADPVWYRDLDRDGYGDKAHSQRASKQPPGHVSNALDCYDENPEAHPGQTRYYEQHRGDGSFDYDCDGKGAKKDDLVAGGCRTSTILGIPTKCWADAGWQGPSPGCGEQGRWLSDCEISTLSCEPAKELRNVQTCR
ncbi:MAG: hypothetical protein HYZ29_03620 [Myxococcales bacterium]|nr:hypothetical protein [Myxococcales bacterium]